MLMFWSARLVLLAVPKTGTTALEAALAPLADAAVLNPPGLKHCTVPKYRREVAAFFEQRGRRPMELVATMREPLDWLGSWWRYRGRPSLDGQPNSTAGVTFDAFCEAWLSDDPPPFARVGSQARFLQGGVDHLFRQDRPEALLMFLAERLGELPDVGRANVSPEGPAEPSPEVAARLRAERPEEFALWESLVAG
jgi:hypothetical protein